MEKLMARIKAAGRKLLPFLPFIILAIAILVAIYHIKVYW
jgi:hypothetical protein